MLNPSFFGNVELGELSPLHRLLLIGLSCWADKDGLVKDRPRQIKHDVLPLDDCDVNKLLSDLEGAEFISRYVFENIKYIQIINWDGTAEGPVNGEE